MIKSNIYNQLINKTKNITNPTFIIDFDQTITTYNSDTSIGVFSKVLGKKYKTIKKRIDSMISKTESRIIIYFLWMLKIILLKFFSANKHIKEVSKKIIIRSDFVKFFNYCKKNEIEIIICSSGYGPLIKFVLKSAGLNKIKIIANNNILRVITPYNKNNFIKNNMNNVIVVGDIIEDVDMYYNPTYTFGICNNLDEYDKLQKVFDYVVHDAIKIENTYLTSKTMIGICKYNCKKYFFKIKNINCPSEIDNYKFIKDDYKVSKTAIVINNMIIYDYIDSFKNKTINDYLYGNNELLVSTYKIFGQYKNSIIKSLKILNEDNCENNIFFKKRIQTIKDNLKKMDFDSFIINKKEYDVKKILIDIIKKISMTKQLFSFLSQGDPTDTNIAIDGYITDFEVAGYNHIVGEIAIFFVSLFSHGRYFYPKYNKSAYIINKAIINDYEKYKININYCERKDTVYIKNIFLNIPQKNKKLLYDYIRIFLNCKFYNKYSNDFKLLKYYICMRLLTPISIDKMDKDDKITILCLVIIIYSEVEKLEDLIKIINL